MNDKMDNQLDQLNPGTNAPNVSANLEGQFTAPAFKQSAGGLFRRLIARIIDGIIVGVLTGPLYILLNLVPMLVMRDEMQAGGLGGAQLIALAVRLLLGTLIQFSYYAYFYKTKGGSLGKLLMNLRIVNSKDGTHLSVGTTILRETIGNWVFSISLVFLGLGFWLAVFRKDKRTIMDFLADSQVLHIQK